MTKERSRCLHTEGISSLTSLSYVDGRQCKLYAGHTGPHKFHTTPPDRCTYSEMNHGVNRQCKLYEGHTGDHEIDMAYGSKSVEKDDTTELLRDYQTPPDMMYPIAPCNVSKDPVDPIITESLVSFKSRALVYALCDALGADNEMTATWLGSKELNDLFVHIAQLEGNE